LRYIPDLTTESGYVFSCILTVFIAAKPTDAILCVDITRLVPGFPLNNIAQLSAENDACFYQLFSAAGIN